MDEAYRTSSRRFDSRPTGDPMAAAGCVHFEGKFPRLRPREFAEATADLLCRLSVGILPLQVVDLPVVGPDDS